MYVKKLNEIEQVVAFKIWQKISSAITHKRYLAITIHITPHYISGRFLVRLVVKWKVLPPK